MQDICVAAKTAKELPGARFPGNAAAGWKDFLSPGNGVAKAIRNACLAQDETDRNEPASKEPCAAFRKLGMGFAMQGLAKAWKLAAKTNSFVKAKKLGAGLPPRAKTQNCASCVRNSAKSLARREIAFLGLALRELQTNTAKPRSQGLPRSSCHTSLAMGLGRKETRFPSKFFANDTETPIPCLLHRESGAKLWILFRRMTPKVDNPPGPEPLLRPSDLLSFPPILNAGHPMHEPEDEILAALIGEFLDEKNAGKSPDLAALLARCPEAKRSEFQEAIGFAQSGGETAAPKATPKRFGDFELHREIGRGGMGVVYEAQQRSVNRRVALKILSPWISQDAAARTRLEREAQALAKLRHPHIVTLFSSGQEDGVHYFVMDFVPGKTLDAILEQARDAGKRVSIPQLLRWNAQIARALEYAHGAGIVHRDIKPANIRITSDGNAMLLDFGLARDASAKTLTMTGSFQGSPFYASPEQIEAHRARIDARTDIYSLGVTLYECVTGRVPFQGETPEQIFHQILRNEPVPPRRWNRGISKELEAVILRAIEKRQAHRYESAKTMAEDLEAILEFRPIQASPAGPLTRSWKWVRRNRKLAWASSLGLVFALLGLGNWAWTRHAERALRQDRVAALLEEARSLEVEIARDQEEWNRLNAEQAQAGSDPNRFIGFEEQDKLAEQIDRAQQIERRLTASPFQILNRLHQALRLDPNSSEAQSRLLDHYVERWRAASKKGQEEEVAEFRRLVQENDTQGRFREELFGLGSLRIESLPSGAEVFLFRTRRLSELRGGPHDRLVPAPLGKNVSQKTNELVGKFALRVIRGQGAIQTGDNIFEVNGFPVEGLFLASAGKDSIRIGDRLVSWGGKEIRQHFQFFDELASYGPQALHSITVERGGGIVTIAEIPTLDICEAFEPSSKYLRRLGGTVSVFQNGELRTLECPSGIETRLTGAPLLATSESFSGTTPLELRDLEPGSYLALLRAPGCEATRFPIYLDRRAELKTQVKLPRAGLFPPGFVYVPSGPPVVRFLDGEVAPYELAGYAIAEREVVASEYLEFLNDPETQKTLLRGTEPLLYPRVGSILLSDPSKLRRAEDASSGEYWKRTEDGLFVLPRGLEDLPVTGISIRDARAYLEWKTKKSRERGLPWVYSLPVNAEWLKASSGVDGRTFPFGRRYLFSWILAPRATRSQRLLPTMSFPLDESPYGVFDLAGSIAEFCGMDADVSVVKGGSWVVSPNEFLMLQSAPGVATNYPAEWAGFRPVIRNLPKKLR